MSDCIKCGQKLHDGHALNGVCDKCRGQAHSPAPTGSPAPSWDDFCARMKQCAPALMPDETDAQWQNLYGVYQLGYSSALEAVMKTLEQENDSSSRTAGT